MSTLSLISVGTNPNDGTGDALRAAFQKTNAVINQINGKIQADTAAPTTLVNLFNESGDTEAVKAKWITQSSDPSTHSSEIHSSVHIEARPVGSGINGPGSADYAFTTSMIKQGWTGASPSAGEIDGGYVVLRQSGPESNGSASTNADAAGILLDVQNRGNCGYICLIEGTVSNIDRSTFQIVKKINVQLAPINSLTTGQQSYGVSVNAAGGANDNAFYAQDAGGGSWASILKAVLGGTTVLNIDNKGRYNGAALLSGAGDPNGTVTAVAPALYLRNDPAAGFSLYVKQTGSGNTGWFALAARGGMTADMA